MPLKTSLKLIEVQNLAHLKLPQAFNLTITAGQGIGIFGPNGSGKSTLLDTIAGVLPLQSGRIEISGTLGYAMQQAGFEASLTVFDNLYLEGRLLGLKKKILLERLTYVAEVCGVTAFLKNKYGRLSTGMKARVTLAASLLNEPDILLLDEAFNALDEATIKILKEVLLEKKQAGMMIVFVSHQKSDFLGLCNELVYFPSLRVEKI